MSSERVTRRMFLGKTAALAGLAATPALERAMAQAGAGDNLPERQRIEQAIITATDAVETTSPRNTIIMPRYMG